jgi:hypothetical protein
LQQITKALCATLPTLNQLCGPKSSAAGEKFGPNISSRIDFLATETDNKNICNYLASAGGAKQSGEKGRPNNRFIMSVADRIPMGTRPEACGFAKDGP